jgi:hypothetical protein
VYLCSAGVIWGIPFFLPCHMLSLLPYPSCMKNARTHMHAQCLNIIINRSRRSIRAINKGNYRKRNKRQRSLALDTVVYVFIHA